MGMPRIVRRYLASALVVLMHSFFALLYPLMILLCVALLLYVMGGARWVLTKMDGWMVYLVFGGPTKVDLTCLLRVLAPSLGLDLSYILTTIIRFSIDVITLLGCTEWPSLLDILKPFLWLKSGRRRFPLRYLNGLEHYFGFVLWNQ